MGERALKERWQTAFYLLLVLLVVGGVVGGVVVSGNQADLVALRDDLEDTEDELFETEADLAEADADLRRLRKKQRGLENAATSEEEAEAFAVEGLSADGSDFTCIDFRCLQIKANLQFFNDTDVGSPVTCVIEIDHANGKLTHDSYTSPYVPPEGEDHQRWFYYSPLTGTEITTYTIGECRRDEEPGAD